jgi:predicted phage tail protein
MLILLTASTNVFAADVSLAWDPKTDSGLAGYNLYYGTSSSNYDVKIPAGTQSTYTVTGLAAGTYYFAVTAYYTSGIETDFSNEVTTTVDSTPSSDTTAPLLSPIQVTNVTDNSARIIWTTNENSDMQVEYGKTTAYGSSTPQASALANEHSVSLSGLSPYTDYHFRVKSRDAAGNLTVSPDYTFRTLLPSPVNVTLK